MRLQPDHSVRSRFHWATDPELVVLMKWRSGSPDRCRREEVAQIIRGMLQREEQAWVNRREGVQRVLAKAVRRIRWLDHSNEVGFDNEGLMRCLRARMFLGLLEEQMRHYIAALSYGFGGRLLRRQTRYVRRVLRTLCRRGRCDAGYCILLCMLVQSCKTGVFMVHPHTSLFGEASKWHLGSWHDIRRELQERIRFWKTIPLELKNAPAHKHVCWQCKQHYDWKLLRCANCKLACYCGPDCQAQAWTLHRRVCKQLNGLKNKGLEPGDSEEAAETTTWGEQLCRRMLCPLARRLRGAAGPGHLR